MLARHQSAEGKELASSGAQARAANVGDLKKCGLFEFPQRSLVVGVMYQGMVLAAPMVGAYVF